MQLGVAVIKRDAPVESLVDVDFGSSKAAALGLLGDLQALSFPLHDVIVADHALVEEAADAVKILRRGAPCGLELARPAGEAAVVVGEKSFAARHWRSPDRKPEPGGVRCTSDLAARPRDVRRGLWLADCGRR